MIVSQKPAHGEQGGVPASRFKVALAAVLVPLLPISGAAFLLPSPALYGLLYVSLPLLLVWTGAVGAVLARRRR